MRCVHECSGMFPGQPRYPGADCLIVPGASYLRWNGIASEECRIFYFAGTPRVAQRRALIGDEDAVASGVIVEEEHAQKPVRLDLQADLLARLPPHRRFRVLVHLDVTGRKAPLSEERLSRPTDEKEMAVAGDDGRGTNLQLLELDPSARIANRALPILNESARETSSAVPTEAKRDHRTQLTFPGRRAGKSTVPVRECPLRRSIRAWVDHRG